MARKGIRLNVSLEDLREKPFPAGLYPVYGELPADLLTPVAVYLKFARGGADSFLLESVEGGEHLARYSFLGRDPFLQFRARGREIRIEGPDGTETPRGDPIECLRRTMKRFHRPRVPGLPRFAGGAVGYFSYDTSRYLEAIPDRAKDDLEMDDIRLGFYDTVLAFDHLRHRILIICHVRTGEGDQVLRESFDRARRQVESIAGSLSGPIPEPSGQMERQRVSLKSNFTQAGFEQGVKRIQEHIRAGEVYQVVLSQRFEGRIEADPFTLFRSLRRLNPSPYMYYLALGDISVLGASPEMLARVEDGVLQTRPIAGTRPRGRDEAEDRRLAEELKGDAKERAEHLMLLDLGRNDVGRVCQPGSVEVTEFMQVQKFSHVQHLVSTVRGRIRPEIHPLDAFLSCFPAGTVTGAPKVRAMEVIEELEPTRRGPYAGAVAYIDFCGSIDSCITIRTMVVKGGRAFVQAGAGIVADSVPAAEFQETIDKAAPLRQILMEDGRGSDDLLD